MAGKKGQKKRFWSDDEKRSICGQTWAPGVSVAQVALRYAMNANLIHKWLRDPRFAPEEETGEALDAIEVGFVPVEIADAVPVPCLSDIRVSAPALTEPVSAQRVDITLSDGRRILVEGSTALSAVLALLSGRGIDFIHGGPEPHGTVSNRQFGGIHSPAFEAEQNLSPTLGGLAYPILDSQEPLLATSCDPNNHKGA